MPPDDIEGICEVSLKWDCDRLTVRDLSEICGFDTAYDDEIWWSRDGIDCVYADCDAYRTLRQVVENINSRHGEQVVEMDVLAQEG